LRKILTQPTDISNQSIPLYKRKNLATNKLPFFLGGLLFILVLYAFNHSITPVWIKAGGALMLLFAAVFLKKFLYHPIFWVCCLGYFIATLMRIYFLAANHHFVACYLLVAVVIFLGAKAYNEKIFKFHLRFLILGILCFSALHKFLSTPYMSGTFFQMQINLNIFFKPLGLFLPEWETITNTNQSAFQQLLKTNPNYLESATFQAPISNLPILAQYSSWGAVIIEALAAIAIFFKSAKLYSHWLLCATILGVFLFRFETGFLSFLAIMGFYLAPTPMFQKIYLGCIALFSLLIISGYGLR
jgi:hypothetical protein